MLDLAYFHVCEAACALFAVTADEGDGAALLEQLYAILHLPLLDAQQLGDIIQVQFFHDL